MKHVMARNLKTNLQVYAGQNKPYRYTQVKTDPTGVHRSKQIMYVTAGVQR